MEVGEEKDVERGGGGEGTQQNAGSRSRGGDVEGGGDAAAERHFVVVAEQHVDAVVDPEADDDRDEHD